MNNPGCSTIIALFVRIPVAGMVKTRLAADLGSERTCHLYQAMVSDILRNMKASGFPIYLFHDGMDCSDLPKEWIIASHKTIVQQGDSIGERMASAFRHCFMENVEQVVLVGSDIPGIDSRVIIAASETLKLNDIAIAPSEDGGYCLIASKRGTNLKNIFHSIPWSTDQVLQSTLQRCDECNLSVALLEPLLDIDTIHDIRIYCKTPFAKAVATNSSLKSFGLLI